MSDLSVLGPAIPAAATSLVDGIHSSLGTAIASGALPAGFRLREIPLAAHFGCSTTPVREAIRKLEHDGLVKVYPRRGAEVVSISSNEVAQLYETRTVLECYAVRKAAEQRPAKAALGTVREIVRRQQQALAHGRPAHEPPMDADFHREITALAGNPVIAELVERTVRQIEAVQARSSAVVQGESSRTCRAHASIVTAVSKGDADRAEAVMREHLGRAQRAVMAALTSQDSPARQDGPAARTRDAL